MSTLAQHIIPGKSLMTSATMPAYYNFSYYSSESELVLEGIDGGVAPQPASPIYFIPESQTFCLDDLFDVMYAGEVPPFNMENEIGNIVSSYEMLLISEIGSEADVLKYLVIKCQSEAQKARQAEKKSGFIGFLRRLNNLLEQ